MGAFLAWLVSLRVPARPHKREESELSMMSGVRVSGGPHVGGTCVWGGVDADAAVGGRLGKIESPALDVMHKNNYLIYANSFFIYSTLCISYFVEVSIIL